MSAMSRVERTLRQFVLDLTEVRVKWALVGGLAVSTRVEPRMTRDVDAAVAVESDDEAEQVAFQLQQRGYKLQTLLENRRVQCIATARLEPPESSDGRGAVVDLLFGSSGIEREIVVAADTIEVLPSLWIPVATIGHLIAMKTLARDDRERPQDYDDLRALILEATDEDLRLARESVALIADRGFHRGRELASDLEHIIRQVLGEAGPS
jgi:predicted nucleotidyltransferase